VNKRNKVTMDNVYLLNHRRREHRREAGGVCETGGVHEAGGVDEEIEQ
jgi:hypothetical protein